MRQTHTYVTMQLSAAAYAEIKEKMVAAGYDHVFGRDGEIDMHGIAVVPYVNEITRDAVARFTGSSAYRKALTA
jgi:hypothetical protein